MRSTALFALASLFALGSAVQSATPTPPQMQHIIASTTAPGTDPKSFEAQPKEYWRVGNEHGRIAEQPDTKLKIQKLLIINPPILWDIELFSKQGQHFQFTKRNRPCGFPSSPPLTRAEEFSRLGIRQRA